MNGRALEPFIKRLAGAARVLVNWERANAGHYQVQALWEDKHLDEQITIYPRKLSRQGFAALLEDLENRLPAQVAIALQRVGGLIGLEVMPPEETTLAAELVRLRRSIYGTQSRLGLASVLRTLAGDPYRVLQRNDLLVRLEQVRRPHPTRLVEAIRPHNLNMKQQPIKVFDERVEHSVDVLENRLVNVFYHQVNLRIRRLQEQLHHAAKAELLEDAKLLLNDLSSARQRAHFLDEVSLPAHLPLQVTMVFLKVPVYGAALEGFLELNRSVTVRFETPELESPLENLPYLYEVWATLKVLHGFLEVCGDYGYQLRSEQLFERKADGAFIRLLPGGQPAAVLTHPVTHAVVKLIPQRHYAKGGLCSVSYPQVPDVAIEFSLPDGETHVAIFDAKYKLDGEILSEVLPELEQEAIPIPQSPKKVDIDKMHTYRDAIRDEHGQRVVQYASILYPGPFVSYSQGLEALGGDPADGQALEEHLVEALSLFLRAGVTLKVGTQ